MEYIKFNEKRFYNEPGWGPVCVIGMLIDYDNEAGTFLKSFIREDGLLEEMDEDVCSPATITEMREGSRIFNEAFHEWGSICNAFGYPWDESAFKVYCERMGLKILPSTKKLQDKIKRVERQLERTSDDRLYSSLLDERDKLAYELTMGGGDYTYLPILKEDGIL